MGRVTTAIAQWPADDCGVAAPAVVSQGNCRKQMPLVLLAALYSVLDPEHVPLVARPYEASFLHHIALMCSQTERRGTRYVVNGGQRTCGFSLRRPKRVRLRKLWSIVATRLLPNCSAVPKEPASATQDITSRLHLTNVDCDSYTRVSSSPRLV